MKACRVPVRKLLSYEISEKGWRFNTLPGKVNSKYNIAHTIRVLMIRIRDGSASKERNHIKWQIGDRIAT